jgi:hypothetical protein
VGTGLPMTWALMHLLYDSFWTAGRQWMLSPQVDTADGPGIKRASVQKCGILSGPDGRRLQRMFTPSGQALPSLSRCWYRYFST